MPKSPSTKRSRRTTSFRVGRVRAYLRGRVWYLCYREQGKRHQPRVGPDRDLARQMAAEINAQLEVGTPSPLGFDPISIPKLRERWLEQHEHVRRSSLQTIRRYRSATKHLITFVSDVCPLRRASDFRPSHAEEFVRYRLKTIFSVCVLLCATANVAFGRDASSSAGAAVQDVEPITIESLLTEMVDRDAVARLPQPDFRLRQQSSYDRLSKTPDDPQGWFANKDHDGAGR